MAEKHALLLAAIEKAGAVNKRALDAMADKAISACMVRAFISNVLNAEREVCALMAEDHADAIESSTAGSDPIAVCNEVAAGIRTRIKSGLSTL